MVRQHDQPDTEGKPQRLLGLPPIVSANTQLLILGSFPGVASLRAQRYYAHPQNQFWKILQAIWPEMPMDASRYEQRCQWLLDRGLGLWDVYAACEREGSLDTAIRNAEVNDFAALKRHCPQLKMIAHNGGESFKHAKLVRSSLGVDHFPLVKLPSTSPANASWSLARKLAAWREVMVAASLV
jgi:hypoxanthine-DNA glycosylase